MQNVLISGLRVVNNTWFCKECIKSFGGHISSNNSILVFNDPTNSIPLKYKTVDYILLEEQLKQ